MIIHKYILTPDQVYAIYGIHVDTPCTVTIENNG